MIKRYQSGVIGDLPNDDHDKHKYNSLMEQLKFNEAIDEAWSLVKAHNQYIENVKPWEIAKKAKDDKDEENHLAEVLAHSAAGILQIADLLDPFMPTTSEKIRTIFASGVVKDEEIGILFPKIYLKTEDPRARKVEQAQNKANAKKKK